MLTQDLFFRAARLNAVKESMLQQTGCLHYGRHDIFKNTKELAICWNHLGQYIPLKEFKKINADSSNNHVFQNVGQLLYYYLNLIR